MSKGRRRKREMLQIVLAATAGEATEEQFARLSELIVADPALARYEAELMSQEAWLNWHGSQVQTSQLLQRLTYDTSAVGNPEHGAWERQSVFQGVRSRTRSLAGISAQLRRPMFFLAASLLGIGFIIGALATHWSYQFHRTVAFDNISPHSARFVQGTACIWAPGMQTLDAENSRLRTGESLNLLEGLAEIEVDFASGGRSIVQIEGPARMVLTANGTPSLTQGKFCADIQPQQSEFAIETPLGQVIAATNCSVGVAVYGLEVEIHVFSGKVTVESPWTADGAPPDRYVIEAGHCVLLSASDSQALTAAKGTAEPARFASQTSMRTDRLEISEDYVQEIIKAQPLLYWRFETEKDGAIPNDAGENYRGKIFGSPSWASQGDNRAIEFGAGLSDEVLHARIESDCSFESRIVDSYTIEAWVKPSHYHLGTLSSLVHFPEDQNQPASHGALLELGGPLTTPSTIEHPGRIRFLHRDPPSDDVAAGTSCFSKGPYDLRRWEHVVAVKDGGEMRLYIDGELVAKAEDNTKLAPDLTLLVGQLDRIRDSRRFVGQLDELAVYDRALSDGEIRVHYRLIRPKPKSATSSI